MLGKYLPLIILGVVNILLGIVVWTRDNRKLSNISFLGLTFSVGLWCIGIAAFYVARDEATALSWTRLYYAAPVALVSFLVLFSLTFPDKTIKLKYVSLLLAPSLVFLFALVLSPHFIVENIAIEFGAKNVTLHTASYLSYFAFIVVYFLTGLGVLAYNRRRAGVHRRQLSFFLVGSIIPAALGVTFNLLLPLFGNYRLIWAGPLATTIFALFVGLNIVLNKMFDIRMFVVRAFAYSVTALVLATVYIAPLMYLLMWSFGVTFSWVPFIVSVLCGTTVATTYYRIKSWFNRLTNQIFFRDVYEPGLLLAQLNKSLVETIDINRLLTVTNSLLNGAFKPEYCVSMIRNSDGTEVFQASAGTVPDELKIDEISKVLRSQKRKTFHVVSVPTASQSLKHYMEATNIHAVTRLTIVDTNDRQVQGYIVLGPRKSGVPYATTDMQVLDTVGNTLMIALQNALHFEEIHQFNVTLQDKIEDATRKLRATNEKLKKLDETKDEFISMASHQLRTPLTSVKGYLSMVLEGDAGALKPQQAELLKQSFLSSERMVNLIADLLNLSRLNTGRFVIETTPTDLRNVVEAEMAQLHEVAKAKGLELIYERPESFPTLELDENKIHQVVMNFIDNAIYYTLPGGKITVSLIETPSAVEYRVVDNGIGVPKDMQHRLFTKFYRADNARRMRPDGTGLGIFMAKKVVIAQGGAIIFDSEEGKGSTFGFRFSKKHAQVAAAEQGKELKETVTSKA